MDDRSVVEPENPSQTSLCAGNKRRSLQNSNSLYRGIRELLWPPRESPLKPVTVLPYPERNPKQPQSNWRHFVKNLPEVNPS
ncbi:hypothetical protein IQ235_10350 [Oscillatoriales cyanobacterium LEGE 11467]|uniref:Uncharacterized protein n=1 Tax=Zarconia navalis LEGE 11467 TaxID=1828826 RepID=A0A928VXN4_9CYAN|nr:hypothetical protein [Zarconia navalis]MBE9041178.1 hypothetical protein [Zarconia navalis LEGE 11467]